MALSRWYANNILDNAVNNESNKVSFANVFVSLHSASPGTDGSNELSGGNYARCSSSPSDWGAAASKEVENSSTFTFATPNAAWATANYAGLWTQASGGTFLCGGDITAAFQANANDTVQITAGNIKFSL